MFWMFLSVVAICVTAFFTYRVHLLALPRCTRVEFESMKVAHNNLTRTVTTLANKVGLSVKLHSAE